LLPHLRDNSEVELVSVATTKSLSGLNAQRKFGFATITTSVETVLDDDTLDAVFVVTRHHSHAGLVCEALKRGLTVFVEKPLALTEDQLGQVLDTVEETGNGRVMVGFNRRFAPLFTDLRTRLAPFRGPLSARYLVNAGRLDRGSWYLNEELEGSRFAGEGGHFIDTLSALVGHHPVEVQAITVPCATRTNPWRRSPTSPTAARVSRRKPWTSPETDGLAGWTTSSGLRFGRPRERVDDGRWPVRTRASARSLSASFTLSAPGPPCRSRSSPSWRQREQAWRWAGVWRPANR
jgi:predicted dehydrogenase